MLHWPGDPEYRIQRISDFARGDDLVLSSIKMSVHTGTHVDAPLHFLRGGAPIDQLPLHALVGEARVVEIANSNQVESKDLEEWRIQTGERILLKTANSSNRISASSFDPDFAHISPEAARYLAAVKIAAIGIDYLSIGSYHSDGAETHRILLEAGIWIVEGLNLAALKPGRYELICLPLKLIGAEGAPARAIARPLQEQA